ncbi:hypothetical protein ACN4EK_24640 [Pantanalinema rosaneae CENA516]|uniref:hypothetical protein n=1 Tax=Pantanalinema rosaneae TaxID=1620701 RepID=UPI003D6E42DD
MNSQTTQTTTTANKSAIRTFHHQMIDAWNRARKLTLERQFFLGAFDSLSAEVQRQVTDLVTGIKQRHQADQS